MEEKRVMSERIKKIYEIVRAPKIAFSVEKASLFTEAYQKFEGDPNVIRMAKAQSYICLLYTSIQSSITAKKSSLTSWAATT